MNALTSRIRGRGRFVTAIAAGCAAIAAVGVSGFARADQSAEPSGQFAFVGKVLVGCPAGAILCSKVTYTGDLAGTGTVTLLATIPSPTVGESYFYGKQTITTSRGVLNCDLNGAENIRGDGEFGEICTITSGTGAFKGATGHLRMFGTETQTLLVIPSGGGDYKATIHYA